MTTRHGGVSYCHRLVFGVVILLGQEGVVVVSSVECEFTAMQPSVVHDLLEGNDKGEKVSNSRTAFPGRSRNFFSYFRERYGGK